MVHHQKEKGKAEELRRRGALQNFSETPVRWREGAGAGPKGAVQACWME